MPTEIDLYLDSLAADNAELRGVLATAFAKDPKAQDRAVTAHRERLAHADYTKKTQELQRDRERATAEVTEMNKQLSSALKKVETGQITAAQYRSRLESIGEEYGIDVADVLANPAANPNPAVNPAAAPVIDPKILERLDAAEKNYRLNPEVSALLLDAQVEYSRIFGNLDGFRASDVLNYARENKVALLGDPKEGTLGAFERLYKVPEKKHEMLVAKITAEATAKADAAVQTRVDQMLAGRSTGENNPNTWGVPGSRVLTTDFRNRNNARIDERAGAPTERPAERTPPSQSRSAAESEINGGAAGFAKSFMQRRAAGVGYGVEKVA